MEVGRDWTVAPRKAPEMDQVWRKTMTTWHDAPALPEVPTILAEFLGIGYSVPDSSSAGRRYAWV